MIEYTPKEEERLLTQTASVRQNTQEVVLVPSMDVLCTATSNKEAELIKKIWNDARSGR